MASGLLQLSWGKISEFVVLYLSGHIDGRSHRYLYHPRILFNLSVAESKLPVQSRRIILCACACALYNVVHDIIDIVHCASAHRCVIEIKSRRGGISSVLKPRYYHITRLSLFHSTKSALG